MQIIHFPTNLPHFHPFFFLKTKCKFFLKNLSADNFHFPKYILLGGQIREAHVAKDGQWGGDKSIPSIFGSFQGTIFFCVWKNYPKFNWLSLFNQCLF
jgi:hypothetical protein